MPKYLFPILTILSSLTPWPWRINCQNTNTKFTTRTFQQGKIKGVIDTLSYNGQNNRQVEIYRGIKYGHQISGSNRFRKGKLFTQRFDFLSVYDATKSGVVCPQDLDEYLNLKVFSKKHLLDDENFWYLNHEIHEECLNLDLYMPIAAEEYESNETKNLPITIFIYNNDFHLGNSQQFSQSAKILALKTNTIVAIPNYRLGLLGFFSSASHEAFGNYGLWDQRLAMEWIRMNAKFIKGDEDNITLLGHYQGCCVIVFFKKITQRITQAF